MSKRRPPDILRKSHAHSERNRRAESKRSLEHEVDAALDEDAEPALLIDLDGVVYRSGQAIDGAAEAIEWLERNRVPHLFVTNTTSRPRSALVEKLAAFGIETAVESIQAPADVAADWLAGRGARRVLLAVPTATAEAFDRFDAVLAAGSEEPGAVDAVVVGDLGQAWSFDVLNRSFRCLMQDPQPLLVALGMTRFWRAEDGLRLDTAPFVVALAHAADVEPEVLGKPSQAFFSSALERLGGDARQAWMVGDDIRADIDGAQQAGLRAILVRTGKFEPGDLELGIEPDRVVDSIAELPSLWSDAASFRV